MTHRAVASGLFDYRFQSGALNFILVECGLIATGVGLAEHRLGFGILTFAGLLAALAIPYLRQLLALALSSAYGMMAISLACGIAAESHHILAATDKAGIGILAFLIAYSLHADFVDWVRGCA